MLMTDCQVLVGDLVRDEGAVLSPEAKDRVIALALVRYNVDAGRASNATLDGVALEHQEALASYAAHLLCQQLAAYYSGQREATINAESSSTDSRARNYASRTKELRAAYFAGMGRPDPASLQSAGGSNTGSGAAPAASSSAWPGRSRYSLTINRGNA